MLKLSGLLRLNIANVFCLYSDTESTEFFTSYDEVHESFDAMGLQENLLRGIYAYGKLLSPTLLSQICLLTEFFTYKLYEIVKFEVTFSVLNLLYFFYLNVNNSRSLWEKEKKKRSNHASVIVPPELNL